jgi:hypothetical protein
MVYACSVKLQRRAKWQIALLVLLALAALLVRPASAHLRAASLLVRFSDPEAKGAIADLARHEVDQSFTMLESGADHATVRARIYTPRDVANPPGVVIAHGVHFRGIDEPRLIRFAMTIAATGVAVLTPEVAELCDYKIDPRSIETIGSAAHFFKTRLGKQSGVGVMGLSFAGGLSLIAAADPRFTDDISFVVAVGAHDDLARVLRFFATDAIENPDGTSSKLHAHDYGAVVLVYSHLESFFRRRIESSRATRSARGSGKIKTSRARRRRAFRRRRAKKWRSSFRTTRPASRRSSSR